MKKNDLLTFIKQQELSPALLQKVVNYLSTFPEDISEEQMGFFSDYIVTLQAQAASDAEKALQQSQQIDLTIEKVQQENLEILENIRAELENGIDGLELVGQKSVASAP